MLCFQNQINIFHSILSTKKSVKEMRWKFFWRHLLYALILVNYELFVWLVIDAYLIKKEKKNSSKKVKGGYHNNNFILLTLSYYLLKSPNHETFFLRHDKIAINSIIIMNFHELLLYEWKWVWSMKRKSIFYPLWSVHEHTQKKRE